MDILKKAFNQLGKAAGRELGKRIGPAGFSVTFDSGGSVRTGTPVQPSRGLPTQQAALYQQLEVTPPVATIPVNAEPAAPEPVTSEPAVSTPVHDLSALRTEIMMPASMSANLDDLGSTDDIPRFQKADLHTLIQQPDKLHKGAKNDPEDVRNLQQMLKNIGMGDMLGKSGGKHDGVDGVFGEKTERAIIHFQTSMGLTPSGQVDAKTMQALMEKNSEVVLNQHSQPDAPRTPRRSNPGLSA